MKAACNATYALRRYTDYVHSAAIHSHMHCMDTINQHDPMHRSTNGNAITVYSPTTTDGGSRLGAQLGLGVASEKYTHKTQTPTAGSLLTCQQTLSSTHATHSNVQQSWTIVLEIFKSISETAHFLSYLGRVTLQLLVVALPTSRLSCTYSLVSFCTATVVLELIA